MKRALKKTAKIAAWVLGLVVALLLLLLAEPHWLLNTKTASWAVKKLGADYRPRWTKLSFEVRNDDLVTKRVIFDARDFCVRDKAGEIKACFPVLTLDATIHFGFSPIVSIRRLDRLIVHSSELAVDETSAPPAKKKKKAAKGGSFHLIPPPLMHMTAGLIDVKIPKAVVLSSSDTTTASLAASFSGQSAAPMTAAADVVVSTGPKAAQHYHADVRLSSDLLRLGRATSLDLLADLRGDAGLRAKVTVKLAQPKKNRLELSAAADAAARGYLLRAQVTGSGDPSRYLGDATLAVVEPSGALRRAELRACHFEAPLEKGSPTSADLTCGLSLQPKPLGGAPKGGPKEIVGKLAFHADFKPRHWAEDHFTAALEASLGPDPRFYGFYAKLEASLAGRTGELPQSLTSKHELEVGFTIDQFKDVVAFLSKTDFAIPAPINALHGSVKVTAKTAGDSSGPSQRVDYEASTDLSSPKQSLKTRVTGYLDVKDMFSADRAVSDVTEVLIQDIALQLPYLKLGPMPSPFVDKRIMTGNPKQDAKVAALRPQAAARQQPSALVYDAHILTLKPIMISSNLLKNPVPISLDLHARPEGLSGKINVDPFDIDIFHQKGRVDHLTLTPSPGSSDMGLNGKLVYNRQDVVIDILLLGSTGKPVVAFESNPPMEQNEIVAMLLYGKSPAELSSDQQASAGTASQAFTSGAFGLASLYLFAATPIQSVGYDPATQSYDIKFKLPGGATLGVGSNLQESKTLSLQKRVARNVEIETQLQQNSPGQQGPQGRNAITTFLEWFRRY